MQKVEMTAQGRVQGVGFRWGVYSLALEIGGITGRVWNNDDGTVTILAACEDNALMAKFIQEIQKRSYSIFSRFLIWTSIWQTSNPTKILKFQIKSRELLLI